MRIFQIDKITQEVDLKAKFPESNKLNGTCAFCCNRTTLAAVERLQRGCTNPGEGSLVSVVLRVCPFWNWDQVDSV